MVMSVMFTFVWELLVSRRKLDMVIISVCNLAFPSDL